MTITYQDLDNAISYFENKQFADKTEREFLQNYPAIPKYLTSNQFNILSEDEYMILSFCSLVLVKAISSKFNIKSLPDEHVIEVLETKNWDTVEKLGNMDFEDKVYNTLGKNEIDLADFIIASMENDDEQTEISLPAKEIIFITIKTIFDAFAQVISKK